MRPSRWSNLASSEFFIRVVFVMDVESNEKTNKGPIAPGTTSPICDEIAVVLRRILDRVMPESAGRREASGLVRYGVTFLGTFLWFSLAFLFVKMSPKPNDPNPPAETVFEPSQIAGVAFIETFLQGNPILAFALCLIVGGVFTCLIAATFKHGRPLTFFFCGLFYPSLAINIVKYAFLFEWGAD